MGLITGLLGGSLSALGSMASTAMNIKAAERSQEKQNEYALQQMGKGYEYNEKAADNADKRSRAMYDDYLTYAAQVKQMKEAGLNPAIMYGMGGNPGTSIPHGAQGAGAGNATGVSPLGINIPNIGADMAQAVLATAQANKANAEADNLRGKNGTKGYYEIQKIIEDTKQTTLNNAFQEVNNRWANVMNETKVNLMRAQIDSLFNNYNLDVQKAMLQADALNLEKEKFKEFKRQFNVGNAFNAKKLISEENRFYDGLEAAESKFKRELEHSIDMFTREANFKNEQQAKQFRHDMKMTMWKTAGNILGGGMGGLLLKLIK